MKIEHNKYCQACGMPLIKKEDFSMGDENSLFCVHCTDTEGNVKSCDEIFEGGVRFFMQYIDNNRDIAEQTTRRNMNNQPYWKDKNCEILKGSMLSEEEFLNIFKKL